MSTDSLQFSELLANSDLSEGTREALREVLLVAAGRSIPKVAFMLVEAATREERRRWFCRQSNRWFETRRRQRRVRHETWEQKTDPFDDLQE